VIDRLRQSLQRFLSLFRRAGLDQEHDAEVAAHLDLAIDENRKNGMSDEEARRQALIRLGGVAQTKENYRDYRSIAWLETPFRDFCFALRILRKSPGFCVFAILALALGIGFSSIVFSIFLRNAAVKFAPVWSSARWRFPCSYWSLQGSSFAALLPSPTSIPA